MTRIARSPGGIARMVRDEAVDHVVIGQELLAVMADYVAMIEARNGRGIGRLPDLTYEPLSKGQGLLGIHACFLWDSLAEATIKPH